MKYWVEPPPESGRHLATEERRVALASWTRIAAEDGSTVAYVPSDALAWMIVWALEETGEK